MTTPNTSQTTSALVLGMGRSGRAAAELLARMGTDVTIYDRDPQRLADARSALDSADVSLQGAVAGDTPPRFDDFDRVVASPGLRLDPHPRLVPEVELASEHLDAPLIGVTGTNGKSTTVVLIGEMLRASGMRVPVGGNLGTPLCALVEEPADWVVAEFSSFQLEHAKQMRARVAVLLNLTPDHLDRHEGVDAYGAAKARLAEMQQPGDALVANADDAWARAVADRTPDRTRFFSAAQHLPSGASRDGDELVRARDNHDEIRIPLDELSPACRAQLPNTLAAWLAAAEAGADESAMLEVLRGFEGLAHRAEPICTRAGVDYVNDSKATNPAAAEACLNAQPSPVWWLAGGRGKGADFTPLARVSATVRAAFVFGEAAADIEAALHEHVEVVRVDSLEQALHEAARRAEPGDVVLLSPACASHDQFASFEERGTHFSELARALPC